jgi:hypothetical protein
MGRAPPARPVAIVGYCASESPRGKGTQSAGDATVIAHQVCDADDHPGRPRCPRHGHAPERGAARRHRLGARYLRRYPGGGHDPGRRVGPRS